VRLRVAGIETNGSAESGDGFLQIAGLDQGNAQIVMGLGMVGAEVGDATISSRGLIVPASAAE
jgi:hypothetical protein